MQGDLRIGDPGRSGTRPGVPLDRWPELSDDAFGQRVEVGSPAFAEKREEEGPAGVDLAEAAREVPVVVLRLDGIGDLDGESQLLGPRPVHGSLLAMRTIEAKLCVAGLLSALLAGACASTVPTPRSEAGAEAIREQDVSDARLEADVRLALLEKLGEDVLGVTVKAKGGRVTLIGAVDERSTQELAEEVAKSVPGVVRVDNRLFARRGSPESTTVGRAVGTTQREVDDAVLEMRVGKNLLGEIGRYALDLEVEVTDGVVSLRGTLPDSERKSLALKAAQGTAGVRQVIDLLQVRGP